MDLDRCRLTVIADESWKPKDGHRRVVPICPKLRSILSDAHKEAQPDQTHVISAGNIEPKNISRDFTVLCRRAGVQRYAKPLHTLRKTGLTAWARRFPAHVVAAWAGHASIETTNDYYLQVSEAEYERAANFDA